MASLGFETRVSGAALGIVVTSAGLGASLLLLSALALSKKLRTRKNLFIATMTCIELVLCSTVYPFYIHTYIKGRWHFGDGICLFTIIVDSFAAMASVIHIVTITAYRYLLIERPRVYSLITRPSTLFFIGGCVTVLPLISVAGPRFKYMIRGSDYNFKPEIMQCINPSTGNAFSAVTTVAIMFLLAFLIIVVCYIRIILIFRRSRRRVENEANPGANSGGNETAAMMNRINREARLIKTVCVIFILFALVYIPYPIILGVSFQHRLPEILHVIINAMYWSGPAINGIVYGVMHPDFRKAYTSLFYSVIHCKNKFQG